ncbi:MAG TPA: hypothetical protein VMR37_02570 [Rhabdochlamydiaceae bacterium]|jgi:hypothetical protein|nr:hypothetical protein [Rhabdochlamydiaceae bacterium]
MLRITATAKGVHYSAVPDSSGPALDTRLEVQELIRGDEREPASLTEVVVLAPEESAFSKYILANIWIQGDDEDGTAKKTKKKKKEKASEQPSLETAEKTKKKGKEKAPENTEQPSLKADKKAKKSEKIKAPKDVETGAVEQSTSKKVKKPTRHPPGTRQHLILSAGIVYVMSLSAIFRNEPAIMAPMGGVIADFIKQVYSKEEEGSLGQLTFRVSAVASPAIGAGLFAISKLTRSDNIVLQIFRSFPYADTLMAVGVKCELPKLEKRLIERLEKRELGVSATQLTVISKVVQGTLAAGLMTGVGGIYLTALSAIFVKSNIRSLVDILFEWMKNIENREQQKICLCCVSALMALMGTAGFTGLQFVENPVFKLILTGLTIIGGDTIMRIVKRLLKAATHEEEKSEGAAAPQTLAEKGIKAAKVLGSGLGVALGVYFAGTQLSDPNNISLATIVANEITSPMKITVRGVLKSVLPDKLVLPTILGVVALISSLYLILGDQSEKPWYGSTLFVTMFCIILSLYTLVPDLQGKKIEVPNEDKKKGKEKVKVAEILRDGTLQPLETI